MYVVPAADMLSSGGLAYYAVYAIQEVQPHVLLQRMYATTAEHAFNYPHTDHVHQNENLDTAHAVW